MLYISQIFISVFLGTSLTISQGCSDNINRNEVENTEITANAGNARGNEMPDHQTILEFKNQKGEELRTRYGAHSIGIGRKRIDGVKTDELALVFYVSSASMEPSSSIPDFFEFERASEGTTVSIPTTVIETPQAQEEIPD